MIARLVACLVACLVALLIAAPVHATDPAEALAAAEASVAAAETALEAARETATGDRTTALSLAVGVFEDALAELRTAVIAAGAREREIAFGLARDRASTARLLAALQGTERAAEDRPGLHPAGPLAAARADALLRGLRPRLEAEADALAARLTARDAARSLQADGFAALSRGLEVLQAARRDLNTALLAEGAAPPTGPDPATAGVVRASEDLGALGRALAGPGARGSARTAPPEGLALPVRGVRLRGYREPDGAGVRFPGLVMAAPPLSVVTAPGPGKVRYAGPFIDYGQVLVVRLKDGATLVLAGLAHLTVRTGAEVAAGQPIGLLGGRTLDPEEYVMLTESGAGAGAGQMLHILISDEQGPVDPEPWFRVENG